MGVYYHYTTPEAAKKIIRSGVIKKSSYEAQNGDAAFGDGVYLTQVPPTAPRQWIAFNNYDGLNQTVEDAILKGKVDAYIRLELDLSELVECKDRDRDIFLYPDRDLHIRPHMKAHLGVTG